MGWEGSRDLIRGSTKGVHRREADHPLETERR